jgi:hypothetical protein
MSAVLLPSNGYCTVAPLHSWYKEKGLHITVLFHVLSGPTSGLFGPDCVSCYLYPFGTVSDIIYA